MERETIVYNGKSYHRYPNSKSTSLSRYYYRHDKWKESPVALHRQIWEDHYGPIPKDKCIHHKDGDWSNNTIENLECISVQEHIHRHPASDKTRQKQAEKSKQNDNLGKWRKENPEKANQLYRENGRKSKGLENWRKNNPNLAHEVAVASGKKTAQLYPKTGESLNKWRRENPDLAKALVEKNKNKLKEWHNNNPELIHEHAVKAGKASAEARRKKRESLQSSGG